MCMNAALEPVMLSDRKNKTEVFTLARTKARTERQRGHFYSLCSTVSRTVSYYR